MSYQISLKQLCVAVSEFQASKRNVEDVFNMKDALHRYFLEHAPLFDIVNGQLTINPDMSLYIAWKDSKPSFHWCYKHDSAACEMMLRNEHTEYGDMSHRSVEDWLQILEAGNIISQVTAEDAVDVAVATPILGNCECRILPTGYVWYPVNPSDSIHADDHVTFSYVSNTAIIAYGDYKTLIHLSSYNRKTFLENLSTAMLIRHLGKLIRKG